MCIGEDGFYKTRYSEWTWEPMVPVDAAAEKPTQPVAGQPVVNQPADAQPEKQAEEVRLEQASAAREQNYRERSMQRLSYDLRPVYFDDFKSYANFEPAAVINHAGILLLFDEDMDLRLTAVVDNLDWDTRERLVAAAEHNGVLTLLFRDYVPHGLPDTLPVDDTRAGVSDAWSVAAYPLFENHYVLSW